MKVVVNRCYGGFGFSDAAAEECIRRGMTVSRYNYEAKMMMDPSADFIHLREPCGGRHYFSNQDLRCHPTFVAVVEEMGEAANTDCSELEVVDIPFDSREGWHIYSYDGKESVRENSRSW